MRRLDGSSTPPLPAPPPDRAAHAARSAPSAVLISIIVSTYNRPDALAQVLAGCCAQTDSHYEIIVADDGSGPATRAVIEQCAATAPVRLDHVWHADDGFRLAAIRNRGIRQARGAYLIFLDGDCVPQRDFVARHRALAQASTMVTGSRALLGPSLTQAVLAAALPLADRSWFFWLQQRLGGQVNKLLPLCFRLPDMAARRIDGFRWRGIKGCNMAAWRTDIERVNGFDEAFTDWGHEDADFVARLHNAGVVRKQGYWATEVLHLWHREASRAADSSNRERVLQRLAAHTIRAEQGLASLT